MVLSFGVLQLLSLDEIRERRIIDPRLPRYDFNYIYHNFPLYTYIPMPLRPHTTRTHFRVHRHTNTCIICFKETLMIILFYDILGFYSISQCSPSLWTSLILLFCAKIYLKFDVIFFNDCFRSYRNKVATSEFVPWPIEMRFCDPNNNTNQTKSPPRLDCFACSVF